MSAIPTAPTTGAAKDNANNQVFPNTGESVQSVTDLTIPGRGLDWTFTRTYRSGVQEPGPLGSNWELNYTRRLWVATPQNLAEIRHSFADATPGEVVRIDGSNRADIYQTSGAGFPAPLDTGFISPNGFFTQLTRNPDGSYSERDQSGTVITYAPPDQTGVAVMTSMADHNGNTLRFQYDDATGHLTRVIDTLGRPIDYLYDGRGLLTEVRDFDGRSLRLQYDAHGELVGETSPAVTGTPTGNDFPAGKTTQYAYSEGYPDARLNHELLTVTAPNEVATGGPPRLAYTYDTDPASPNAGRVLSVATGGTNATGAPSGGTIRYAYQSLTSQMPTDLVTPELRTTVTDANGNVTAYEYNLLGNIVQSQVFTNRHVNPSDPASFLTTFRYDQDYHPSSQRRTPTSRSTTKSTRRRRRAATTPATPPPTAGSTHLGATPRSPPSTTRRGRTSPGYPRRSGAGSRRRRSSNGCWPRASPWAWGTSTATAAPTRSTATSSAPTSPRSACCPTRTRGPSRARSCAAASPPAVTAARLSTTRPRAGPPTSGWGTPWRSPAAPAPTRCAPSPPTPPPSWWCSRPGGRSPTPPRPMRSCPSRPASAARPAAATPTRP
jgi:YD repeat-containing protein